MIQENMEAVVFAVLVSFLCFMFYQKRMQTLVALFGSAM